ncbi:hypothetical protein BC831DRAFT_499541 [Entophlyctis helioformis]|nr:hypothetical protein BC831DRAFT_499541 [Entophlyctis helioformis]
MPSSPSGTYPNASIWSVSSSLSLYRRRRVIGIVAASARNDTAATTPQPTSSALARAHVHHTLHSVLQHGQLGFKQPDRLDLSNIPHGIKNMILEQSASRLKDYEAVKVCVRSDVKYSTLDTKQRLTGKKSRMTDVYKCGFCSDPKELYRPLGEPTLDTEALLYKRLDIDPITHDKHSNQQYDDYKEETFHKINIKNQRKFREVPKRHTNGFKYIKEKLVKSNLRVNSVKFGVPFMSICEVDDREHSYDKKDEPLDPDANSKVNWEHLEIDADRQAYFTNLLLRHQRASSAMSSKDGGVKPKKRREEPPPTVYSKQHAQIKLAPKQIEAALGIQHVDQTNEATERFFTTRDDFYEQRQRLTHLLLDDLNRLDYERKTSFERKTKIFELSKASWILQKAQCIDDMTAMRHKSADVRRKEKKDIIASHPWYNELINKVVVMNGVRRDVTQCESLLIVRLKRLIEDQVTFNKKVFVQLMRVLPTREFLKDEIQRIIRFVKQHESISERDYLEAVELAGHVIN